MNIRGKIFLGGGTYVFLAALIGFLAFQEMRTVTGRVTVLELADDMTHYIGEARRYEKNYLLYAQPEDLDGFKRNLGLLNENLDRLQPSIVAAISSEDQAKIRQGLTDYGRLFDEVGQVLRSQDDKIKNLLTHEKSIEGELHDRSLRSYMTIRDHLRHFLLSETPESYQALMKDLSTIKLNGKEYARYRNTIDELHGLYQRERNTVLKMRGIAREIQSFFEGLAKRERDAIHVAMSRSLNLLLFALLSALVLGAFVNTKLAVSIANPIQRMERITKKIADGDFSETLEVKGSDEIASLSKSFNQMVERLTEARASLEDKITQLREKQMQLVEAEKLASIGKLSSGIAHEISNPLTSVLTFSNLMLEKTPEDHPDYGKLRMMVRETERARDIVRQLLSFGRELPINPVKKNINEPVNEALQSMIAQNVFSNLRLNVTLADNLPDVLIDPERIRQVVSNILINAVHAVMPKGSIEVAPHLDSGFVEVIISDTGHGIPKEHMGRVFDPFFTTKDKSRGTGLGLAVSYGIIKKHGGCINVQSEVGTGSIFTVRLPVNV